MASEQPDGKSLEQLVELLVYAPVGLLYEYQEVVPRLVRRGKSQVQLARIMGKMAANQARSGTSARAEAGVTDAVHLACSLLARAVTEVGASVGLAPRGGTTEGDGRATAPPTDEPAGTEPAATEPDGTEVTTEVTTVPDGTEVTTEVTTEPDDAGPAATAVAEAPLPIAGYDTLTAREIISLLADLSPEQRARIRAHEQANRSRKTVLAKLDQLDG